jgi:hypothetical protein
VSETVGSKSQRTDTRLPPSRLGEDRRRPKVHSERLEHDKHDYSRRDRPLQRGSASRTTSDRSNRDSSHKDITASKPTPEEASVENIPLPSKPPMLPYDSTLSSKAEDRKSDPAGQSSSSSLNVTDRKVLLPTPEDMSTWPSTDVVIEHLYKTEVPEVVDKLSTAGDNSQLWKPQSDWERPSCDSRTATGVEAKVPEISENKTCLQPLEITQQNEPIVSLFGAPIAKIRYLQKIREIKMANKNKPVAGKITELKTDESAVSEVVEGKSTLLEKSDECQKPSLETSNTTLQTSERNIQEPAASMSLMEVKPVLTKASIDIIEITDDERPETSVQKLSFSTTSECKKYEPKKRSLLETPDNENSKPKERKVLLATPVGEEMTKVEHRTSASRAVDRKGSSDSGRRYSSDSRSRERRRSHSKSGDKRSDPRRRARGSSPSSTRRHRTRSRSPRERDNRRSRRSRSPCDTSRKAGSGRSQSRDHSRHSRPRGQRVSDEPEPPRRSSPLLPRPGRDGLKGRNRIRSREQPTSEQLSDEPHLDSQSNSEHQPSRQQLLPAPHLLLERTTARVTDAESSCLRRDDEWRQDVNHGRSRRQEMSPQDEGIDIGTGCPRVDHYRQKPLDHPTARNDFRPGRQHVQEYLHQRPTDQPHMDDYGHQNADIRPVVAQIEYHHQKPSSDRLQPLVEEYNHRNPADQLPAVPDIKDLRPVRQPVEEYHQKPENRLSMSCDEIESRHSQPILEEYHEKPAEWPHMSEWSGRTEFANINAFSRDAELSRHGVRHEHQASIRFHPYQRQDDRVRSFQDKPSLCEQDDGFFGRPGSRGLVDESTRHRIVPDGPEVNEILVGERCNVGNDERYGMSHIEPGVRNRFPPSADNTYGVMSNERGPQPHFPHSRPNSQPCVIAPAKDSTEVKKPLLGEFPGSQLPMLASQRTTRDMPQTGGPVDTDTLDSDGFRLKAPPRLLSANISRQSMKIPSANPLVTERRVSDGDPLDAGPQMLRSSAEGNREIREPHGNPVQPLLNFAKYTNRCASSGMPHEAGGPRCSTPLLLGPNLTTGVMPRAPSLEGPPMPNSEIRPLMPPSVCGNMRMSRGSLGPEAMRMSMLQSPYADNARMPMPRGANPNVRTAAPWSCGPENRMAMPRGPGPDMVMTMPRGPSQDARMPQSFCAADIRMGPRIRQLAPSPGVFTPRTGGSRAMRPPNIMPLLVSGSQGPTRYPTPTSAPTSQSSISVCKGEKSHATEPESG